MWRLLSFSLLAVLVVTTPAHGGPAANQRQDRAVTVMTRNLYFGADLTPALAAETVPELIAAVTSIWAVVQASDIPGRAERLADEIAAGRPDLVGLQEVVLWRSQFPPDFLGQPDATTVEYDFLALLLDALAARGLEYSVVIAKVSTDVEAPALLSGGVCCQEIRLTDREVILARTERHHNDPLSLSNVQSDTFVAQLGVPLPGGGLFTGRRSWVSVDVAARGAHFRFLSTHLDPEGPTSPIQEAQGLEVLLGPANTTLPVVYVCDCNSRADGTGTTVHADTLAAGFLDAWSARHRLDPGFTCCQAEDLRNPESLLDQRLDIVFVRGDVHVRHATVTGDEESDRTADGLWPSDHAGVVATIQFRR